MGCINCVIFHLIDYIIKDCPLRQPEYMMSHYSPELSEPATPDDPEIKVYNRFVTLNVQLVHIVFNILIDIVTDCCVHGCD